MLYSRISFYMEHCQETHKRMLVHNHDLALIDNRLFDEIFNIMISLKNIIQYPIPLLKLSRITGLSLNELRYKGLRLKS